MNWAEEVVTFNYHCQENSVKEEIMSISNFLKQVLADTCIFDDTNFPWMED